MVPDDHFNANCPGILLLAYAAPRKYKLRTRLRYTQALKPRLQAAMSLHYIFISCAALRTTMHINYICTRTHVYATRTRYVIKLMVGVASGPGILFPKVGNYAYMYSTGGVPEHRDNFSSGESQLNYSLGKTEVRYVFTRNLTWLSLAGRALCLDTPAPTVRYE